MRNSILVAILLATPAVAEDTCQIRASAKTAAFAKVPIYSAPTSTSEVLDVAPTYQDPAGGPVLGARFVVIGMRDGWAQVTQVTDWSGTVTASDGWIGATNVILRPQTNKAFTVASASSKVLWEGSDWPIADVLIDCKAEWGKVRMRNPDGTGATTAWMRGFCDDQAGICEDVTGD